jgi:hypothetical protein
MSNKYRAAGGVMNTYGTHTVSADKSYFDSMLLGMHPRNITFDTALTLDPAKIGTMGIVFTVWYAAFSNSLSTKLTAPLARPYTAPVRSKAALQSSANSRVVLISYKVFVAQRAVTKVTTHFQSTAFSVRAHSYSLILSRCANDRFQRVVEILIESAALFT